MTWAFIVGAASFNLSTTSPGVDTATGNTDLIVTSSTQYSPNGSGDLGVPNDVYGNTYGTILTDFSYDHGLRLSYAHADTDGHALSLGSSHTWTPNGTYGFGALSVGCFSGSKASGVLDQSVSAGSGSQQSSPQSPGSLTASVANSLYATSLSLHDEATFTSYAATGFTVESTSSVAPAPSSHVGGAFAWKSSSAAENPLWGIWLSARWEAAQAIFKPAAAAIAVAARSLNVNQSVNRASYW